MTVSADWTLRQLLWLRHGCPSSALYGDDGEMQCSVCLIDFKRLSAEEIAERFMRLDRARLDATTKQVPAAVQNAGSVVVEGNKP